MEKNKLKLEPFEDRVIILPDEIEDTMAGGLLVKSDESKIMERRNATNGVIAAISDCAFADWDGTKPVQGDRIVFSKHAGQFYVEDEKEYRIMRDSEVIGIIRGDHGSTPYPYGEENDPEGIHDRGRIDVNPGS